MAGPYVHGNRTIDWTGELWYNGFRFPPQVKVRVESVPVKDSSDRAMKYVRYIFHVDFVVTYDDWIASPGGTDGTGTCDGNVTVLRQRLSQVGCEFKFKGQGFGTLWVNKGRTCGYIHTPTDDTWNGAVDAVYGPSPQLTTFEPIGSNKVWRVVWSVEVTVPECCEGGTVPVNPYGLFEISYDQSWTIDESGLTVRTTTATVEVLPYRLAGSTILLNFADKYRDTFFPLIPQGFRRTSTYQIDRSKRRLEIIIIDREIDSDIPFFKDMVNMSVVESVDGDPLDAEWFASVVGNLTLAPGVPKLIAFNAIASIVLDRFSRSFETNFKEETEKQETATKKGSSIMTRIAIASDMFNRTVTFTFEWTILATLDTILQASGILTPLKQTPNTWADWHTSIWGNVQNPRGYAQMQALDTDDRIMSVCTEPKIGPLQPNGFRRILVPVPYSKSLNPQKPAPEDSYVDLTYSVQLIRESNVSISDVVQDTPTTEVYPSTQLKNQITDAANDDIITQSNSAPSQDDQTLQIRGPSRYYLVFSGAAVRLGYKIPTPKVKSVPSAGGGAPVLLDSWLNNVVLGRTPVGAYFGKQWRQVYQLTAVPTGDILVNIEIDGRTVTSIASLA